MGGAACRTGRKCIVVVERGREGVVQCGEAKHEWMDDIQRFHFTSTGKWKLPLYRQDNSEFRGKCWPNICLESWTEIFSGSFSFSTSKKHSFGVIDVCHLPMGEAREESFAYFTHLNEPRFDIGYVLRPRPSASAHGQKYRSSGSSIARSLARPLEVAIRSEYI